MRTATQKGAAKGDRQTFGLIDGIILHYLRNTVSEEISEKAKD